MTTFQNPYSNFFRRQPKTNWQLTKKENKSQAVKKLKKALEFKKRTAYWNVEMNSSYQFSIRILIMLKTKLYFFYI